MISLFQFFKDVKTWLSPVTSIYSEYVFRIDDHSYLNLENYISDLSFYKYSFSSVYDKIIEILRLVT